MPSIKNFEKKAGKKDQHQETTSTKSEGVVPAPKKAHKRRPGRDEQAHEIKVVHVEQEIEMETQKTEETSGQSAGHNEKTTQNQNTEHEAAAKIEINFPGSELIRSKFPQPFEVAEAVATDWMNDGQFDKIPLQQPLAKSMAQQGLLKAKEIEKKVMASPTTEKIAMQAFTYAMKAQGLFNELKSKVNKK